MRIFSWLIGVTIAASTLAQWLAGYPYTVGQIIGMAAPFIRPYSDLISTVENCSWRHPMGANRNKLYY